MSLFSTLGFLSQEHRSKSNLNLAFQESKKRHTITRQDRQLLDGSRRFYLGAVNQHSRILWAQAVCQEFENIFNLTDEDPFPDQHLFFATLTDARCVTSHDAKSVDIKNFKRRLRIGLAGLSYLGMIEPGYYVNVAPGTGWSKKRLVSWHMH